MSRVVTKLAPVVAITALWLAFALDLRTAGAQSDEPPQVELAAAILDWLTVWERPGGDVVFVSHCRTAPDGCQERVRSIAAELVRAGNAHGVDPWLLAAMALVESGLNPDAIGTVGERGILQAHPRSARGRRLARACARAPERCVAASIWLGAEHLSAAITRCGSEAAALGAYNGSRCGETAYSRRVLRRRELLRGAREGGQS